MGWKPSKTKKKDKKAAAAYVKSLSVHQSKNPPVHRSIRIFVPARYICTTSTKNIPVGRQNEG